MIFHFDFDNAVDVHYSCVIDDITEHYFNSSNEHIIDALPSIREVGYTLSREDEHKYVVYTKEKIYIVFLIFDENTNHRKEWVVITIPKIDDD